MEYERKYKAALKWMQSLYSGLHGATKEEAEHYFPELKDSEDERIVKCLLNYFNHVRYNGLDLKGTDVDEVIAWLEKQGKTLDADKVIEWLKNNGWCTVGGPKVEMAQINKFKKDFEL